MVDASDRKISGSKGEAKARATADQNRRDSSPNILNPHEVRGEYDANRMLETTLGGIKRVMTSDDLAAFRRNAAMDKLKIYQLSINAHLIEYTLTTMVMQ